MISTQSTGYGHPVGSISPPLLGRVHGHLSTALDRIGGQRRFKRNTEIYSEGESANCWFKVISGAVRTTKIFEDGRRHVGQFYFEGDFFGFDKSDERIFSAEAVCDSMVMRYPREGSERLFDTNPEFARDLREMLLSDMLNAQTRMLLLGRMNALERVTTFLLDVRKRRKGSRMVELPMSRIDIADYLGLTTETVCRVLSSLKREGTIGIPSPHRIELRGDLVLRLVA
jgi:CRP/FNR family nitrogen fixation transcriptional regulator